MKSKRVVLRELAELDFQNAIDYYLLEGSEQVASNFVDTLENALMHLGLYPASGSSNYSHELNLPGLRHWGLKQFPYVVFYMERADHIDIWRLLHMQRDIPTWMHTSEA